VLTVGGWRFGIPIWRPIARLIENDQITGEMYNERLNEILALGQEVDEAATGLSPASQELMKVWNDMDAGLIKTAGEAFDEAEKARAGTRRCGGVSVGTWERGNVGTERRSTVAGAV